MFQTKPIGSDRYHLFNRAQMIQHSNIPSLNRLAHRAGQIAGSTLQKHWLKTALLGAAAYMALQKDLNINLQLNQAPAAMVRGGGKVATAQAAAFRPEAPPMNTSLVGGREASPSAGAEANRATENTANTLSNLTAANKGLKEETGHSARKAAKIARQKAYVKRFAKVAQAEMKHYGIPASIILAQGLLESNVGESKLAQRNNNHFGMKCFSKSCKPGHCSNYTDDSHKDFFRIYGNAWESYRAHSLLLKNSERYQPLFRLRSTDYKGWARGLSKAGYATDKKYADKIIHLIEDLGLHRYDR
ncbi:glycoside hydrolase family 73 protein [Phaeodactylibacter luteus]|uniref:glycoside hydrolase family 73 protein n=1 Tax=Phaeodactylibacter luteus TaxID=1564516 RepID=UPI0014795B98|nr:glucosaminidase domain-containing protein [Phaeodactylibacter luteus]